MELISIIEQIGFPIACVVALYYMNMKQTERHKEESDKWVEALNNNTRVIERLVEKLDGTVER